MIKNRLVKGTTRRAIALASAMMLSCSMVVTDPAPLLAHAEEVNVEQEAEGEAAEEVEGQETEDEAAEEAEDQETEGEVTDEAEDQETEGEAAEEVEDQEAEDEAAEEAENQETEDEVTEEVEDQETEDEAAEEVEDQETEDEVTEETKEQEAEGEVTDEAEDQETEDEVAEEAEVTDEAENQETEDETDGETLEEEELADGEFLTNDLGISLLSEAEETSDSWYLAEDTYYESDGYYYIDDEETDETTMVTDRYLEITIDDKRRIIYIDEDGEQVNTGSVEWLGNKGGIDGWRCLNSKGYVILNQNRVIGDVCYAFDEDGEYTELVSEFFVIEDEDDILIYKYATADSTVAKVEGADTGEQHYYFMDSDDGLMCYIDENDAYDQTVFAGKVWLDDTYWVTAAGCVAKDINAVVDGSCYYFDEEGKCELLTSQFFTSAEGEVPLIRYACEDGTAARDGEQYYYFVDEGDETKHKYYCYTDDGELVKSVWIGWVRINSNGRVLMDQTKIINGKCYQFDEDGQGSYIKGQFFEIEIDDVMYLAYACEDASAAGNDNGGYYFLEDEEGNRICQDEDGSQVSSVWVADFMWVNADSVLVENADYEIIDGKYYEIADYAATLLTNQFVEDDGEFYFVDGDGNIVKEQFVEYDGNTLYFDQNGDQVFEEWIELDEGKCYADENGYVLKNQQGVAIDELLYDFDENGYATHVGYVKDGYREEDGDYYYYIDGEKVEEDIIEHEGNLLYFGADGKQLFGCWIDDGEFLCYADKEGHLIVDESLVLMDDGKTYNFDSNGAASLASGYTATESGNYYYEAGLVVTDAVRTDDSGNKMYFGADGVQVIAAWIEDASGFRYADENGYLICDQESVTVDGVVWSFDSDGYASAVNGRAELNGTYYYYEDGVIKTDYLHTDSDGKQMYFGTDGAQVFSGWIGNDADGLRYADADGYLIQSQEYVELDEKTWNFDSEGYASVVNGYVTVDGNGYYYEDGVKLTKVIQVVDEKFLYFDENGVQIISEWVNLDGKYYYANGKGYLVTDQLKYFDSEAKYAYFFENGVMACEEFVEYEGNVLYFGSDGWQCFAQWIELDGNQYYVDENGYRLSGVSGVLLDEKYYDFDENGIATFTGYQYEGYVTIDGNGYYYEDGEKVTEDIREAENELMYFDADGVQIISEWVELDGNWYYANSDGHLIVNKYKQISKKWYHFDQNGIMASDKFIDYEGNTRYFGENGDQKFEAWIEHPEGDYYADAAGYVVKNVTDYAVDGVYYDFDENGLATAVSYSISYVMNGGTNNSSNPFEYTGLTETIQLAAPTRSGYTFKGWYVDSVFADSITQIAEKSSGDITLYAKWEQIVVDDDDDDDSSDSYESSSDGGSSDSSSDSSTSEITESNVVSTESSTVTGSPSTVTGPAAATAEKTAQENSSNAQAVSTATVNQSVAIQVAGTSVSATVSQTTAGSVNGNTITSAAANTTVTVSETEVATVASTAIAADGSARSLLASTAQGTVVTQAAQVADGVATTQNVVVYADGAVVSQQSGAAELSSFAETVVTAEKAIQSGAQTVAEVYNEKVSVDLNQYVQVGSAVTYAVTQGTSGATAKTQLEQTNFVTGQEIVALITDANGNVTVSTIVVGVNGVVQYQIPGVNCIVRFMKKIG